MWGCPTFNAVRAAVRKQGLPALLFALLLAACDGHTRFHSFQPMADEGWSRTDTLTFSLPPADAEGDYQLLVGMRYGKDFPYEGIWMTVETELPPSPSVRRDTVYFRMNMPEEARSRGIMYVQQEMPVAVVHLRQAQQCRIRLRHIMRREVMPDISDIGLRLTSLP